jgi:hypothetical protein
MACGELASDLLTLVTKGGGEEKPVKSGVKESCVKSIQHCKMKKK